MSLNRSITASSARVKMGNFTLDSSLLGMDIHGKTVGVSSRWHRASSLLSS